MRQSTMANALFVTAAMVACSVLMTADVVRSALILHMHGSIARVAGAPDGVVDEILRRHAGLIGTILEGAQGEPVMTLVRAIVMKTASILEMCADGAERTKDVYNSCRELFRVWSRDP
jgi:hypothetical protein